MKTVKFSNKQLKSLVRLNALLNNPELGRWYHHQFIGLGFIPIPYELPEDIKNWRKILEEIV